MIRWMQWLAIVASAGKRGAPLVVVMIGGGRTGRYWRIRAPLLERESEMVGNARGGSACHGRSPAECRPDAAGSLSGREVRPRAASAGADSAQRDRFDGRSVAHLLGELIRRVGSHVRPPSVFVATRWRTAAPPSAHQRRHAGRRLHGGRHRAQELRPLNARGTVRG